MLRRRASLVHPLLNPVILSAVCCIFLACLKKSEAPPVPAATYPISVATFAGNGSPGFFDGIGTGAAFFMPSVLAIDAAGNIYVSDTGNGLIRKMNPSGDVRTFAGIAGDHNSLIGYPYGLAVDASGNIYVGDVGHSQIRKISPQGVISTLAGSGNTGFTDGQGVAASFNGPYGLAVDAAGNVYVADAGNNAIRKITPSGLVSTLAGNGAAGQTDGVGGGASFFSPYGIALDGAGNLYVADTFNQLIRKITPNGTVSTIAGGGSPGSDKPGYFGSPFGVALDTAGNLYVADFDDNQVKLINLSGSVSVLAGSGQKGAGNGLNTDATFNGPSGVAVDAAGNIFVADYRNNLVRKVYIRK